MKKIVILLLSIAMVGCSQVSYDSEKNQEYKDGNYIVSANGYGGKFDVETIMNDDKIVDILVKDNNETPSIGGVAIEQMIDKIKKTNSYDVDIISGATKTSQALKDAVKSGVEKSRKDK